MAIRGRGAVPTDLEIEFHDAMLSIYRRAKTECGYNATRFLAMVSERGGLDAAQTLTIPVLLWSDRRSPSTYVQMGRRRDLGRRFRGIWASLQSRWVVTTQAHVLQGRAAPGG